MKSRALFVFLAGCALLSAPGFAPVPATSARSTPVLTRPAASVRGVIKLLGVRNQKIGARNDRSGVVVWLNSVDGTHPKAGRLRQRMTQKGKRFSPHVMAVEVGTEVDFPNEDPFFHNVFSIFDGRRFDLGLYASGETRPVSFTRPGVSYIFCNIHPQMSAVVVTVGTPYYTISDADGAFALNDVPAGRYHLQFWHERSTPEHLESLARNIEVNSNGLDLGVIAVSEEGYLPRSHRNKYGQEYDTKRNKPAYRKP
jgi:plastocyanin